MFNPYQAPPQQYVRPVQPAVWQQPPTPRTQVPVAVDQTPKPKIRMQAPDAPVTSARISLPSPEALGISRVAMRADVDWNQFRGRLTQLGALGFHVDKVNQGTRLRVFMPAGQGSSQHIEAVADSEAAAVRMALERAETWARR